MLLGLLPDQPGQVAAALGAVNTVPAAVLTPTLVPTPTPAPTAILTSTTAVTRNGPIILVVATPEPVRPVPAAPSRRRATHVTGVELPTVAGVLPVTETKPVDVGDGVVQWDVPRYDAGQHNATPACGEPGNTIIVGHSVWYEESGIFEPLLDVQPGQLVNCTNDDGQVYTYQITRKWDSPYEDGSWLTQEQPDDLLTLYTCRLDLTGLVVVQAKRIDG